MRHKQGTYAHSSTLLATSLPLQCRVTEQVAESDALFCVTRMVLQLLSPMWYLTTLRDCFYTVMHVPTYMFMLAHVRTEKPHRFLCHKGKSKTTAHTSPNKRHAIAHSNYLTTRCIQAIYVRFHERRSVALPCQGSVLLVFPECNEISQILAENRVQLLSLCFNMSIRLTWSRLLQCTTALVPSLGIALVLQ